MPPRSTIDTEHLAAVGVAVELVADPPGDLGHRGIDVGEGPQRLVAEPVARGPGGQHRLHERRLQQRLVAAGDADGDGLGLVLDRVDGAGELLDPLRQRGGEVVDDDAGVPMRPSSAWYASSGAMPSA